MTLGAIHVSQVRESGWPLPRPHFDGDLDEYRRWVSQRNYRDQWYLDKPDRGVVTRNDARQWDGFERMSAPFFDQPMSADEVRQLRTLAAQQILESGIRSSKAALCEAVPVCQASGCVHEYAG